MKTLRESLGDYVGMRRSLGFKLEQTNKYLLSFVSFLESEDATFITTKLALEWAQLPTSARILLGLDDYLQFVAFRFIDKQPILGQRFHLPIYCRLAAFE